MAATSAHGGESWTEGRRGEQVRYREVLYPPALVVLLAIALSATVGVAYGAAYDARLGWLAALLMGGATAALLLATSTRLRVDERIVQAGRARIPLDAVGEATPLDREAMQLARRSGDPRDYLVLRAWSSRRGVSFAVVDPRDPHPRWVVSSRRPQAFAAAINAARATGHR